jgi:ubiquinone biosynthesis protein COQ9
MAGTNPDETKQRLLDAIVMHVPFDGWSPEAFAAAARDVGITPQEERVLFPRGATDLAVMFHEQGDRAMELALAETDLSSMRVQDKITLAIRTRLDVVSDKEVVRRGSALFALPHNAAEGGRLIWGTADAMWRAIGDTSEDVNWYTKRMTLSAVWSSVVLYWLGDTTERHVATDEFIDRRIADVMRFEKAKAQMAGNPLFKPLTGILSRATAPIRAPRAARRDDLPGRWVPQD